MPLIIFTQPNATVSHSVLLNYFDIINALHSIAMYSQDGTHKQTNTTLIWNKVPKSLDVLVDDDDAMQIHPKIGWEATQYQLHSTAKLAQNDLHQTYKIRLAKCFRVQMNPTAVQVQLLHTCFFGSEMTIGTCSGGARSKKIRLKQPTNRKQHSRWE